MKYRFSATDTYTDRKDKSALADTKRRAQITPGAFIDPGRNGHSLHFSSLQHLHHRWSFECRSACFALPHLVLKWQHLGRSQSATMRERGSEKIMTKKWCTRFCSCMSRCRRECSRAIVHDQPQQSPMIVRNNNDLQVVISGNVRANSEINSMPSRILFLLTRHRNDRHSRSRFISSSSLGQYHGPCHCRNANLIIIPYAKTVQILSIRGGRTEILSIYPFGKFPCLGVISGCLVPQEFCFLGQYLQVDIFTSEPIDHRQAKQDSQDAVEIWNPKGGTEGPPNK